MGIIRYLLAFSVLFAHFNVLAGYDFPFPVSSYSGVGGFFALSGFLIYGSYLKKPTLRRYIRSRAVRLLPAYWFTVLFFAVALFFVSDASAAHYFGSAHFWEYLISNLLFLNFLCPTLPDLFSGFEIPAVNPSLWTMKVEWMLYLSVPVVAWIIKKIKCKPVHAFITIYILSLAYRLLFQFLFESTQSEIYNILGRQFFGQLMYFYTGVIIYYYFDAFMRYNKAIILIAAGLLAGADYIPYSEIIIHPLAWGSVVIWLSMVGKWGRFEGKSDNVSYNIYLVHAPVIQLAVCLGIPQAIGGITTLIAVCGICILLGIITNAVIEKPVQRLYRK